KKQRQTIVLGGEIDESKRWRLVPETGYYTNLEEKPTPKENKEKKKKPGVIRLDETMEVDKRRLVPETGYYTNLERPTPKETKEKKEES
ncbi:MAG: hypothetical protein II539_02105, partial [Muribaculaceae bacterium]|nr:hypothetical protein [Muribaculaceae bacterium]